MTVGEFLEVEPTYWGLVFVLVWGHWSALSKFSLFIFSRPIYSERMNEELKAFPKKDLVSFVTQNIE